MRKKIPITSKFFPRHFVFLKNKQYKWYLPKSLAHHPSRQTRFKIKDHVVFSACVYPFKCLIFHRRNIKKKKRRYVLRLYAKQYGYISFAELESARRAIKRISKRALRHRMELVAYPFFYLTKKPAEVRMGKGKGTKLRDKVAIVKPGKIIFELKQVTFRKGIYALRLAKKKFSILTGVTKKPMYSFARYNRILRKYTIFS